MIDPDSRYADLEVLEHVTPDGRTIRYLDRRFILPAGAFRSLGEVRLVDGDRLDAVAARTIGDPLQYWRICDANEAMRPEELLQPGRTLKIPSPI